MYFCKFNLVRFDSHHGWYEKFGENEKLDNSKLEMSLDPDEVVKNILSWPRS